MEVETRPGELDTKSLSRRPQYYPTYNLGQIIQLVPILGAIGIGYAALTSSNAVRDERISTIQKEAEQNKAAAAKESATLAASLTEIKSDVKAVSNAVQSLSLQVQLSTARQDTLRK
jgi:hypothetical protein